MAKTKVLLTGPSGRIGRHLLTPFEERYELHTFDLLPSTRPRSYVGSLQDMDSLRLALCGMDAVLHLAATSDEAPFQEELLPNNIKGLYNLLEAAHLENVKRVVFASSVQTVWNHFDQTQEPIETGVHAPCSLYGISKIFGELTGQWYFHHHGLEFVAIRLGFFSPTELLEPGSWINNIWISPGDAVQLFQRALEVPDIGFAIVNGTSDTPRELLSLRSARELLGYQPCDRAQERIAD